MNALRRHRFALAFIALAATILFLPPLLKNEVFTLRDHFDYFQPLRYFTAVELKAGHLPFWNPYSASGEAWLANPQAGVFYPPAWLFLVVRFPTAYMLYLLFHLLVLGWTSYLLFARRASAGAALVGAVALTFSGPVLSLLDISNNLATFAWIPLVLWCAAEGAPIAGGFALALAFLAGEPFFAAVAALMFVIVSRKPRVIAIAAVTAFGLAAIQLLPFLALLAGTDRAVGMKPELIFRDSMPLRDWIRIAIPPHPDASGFDPALGQHFIPVIYVGVVVVVLALIGLTRVRSAAIAGWLALLAIVIALAAGPRLLAHLPLTLFRYPARLLPLGALAIVAIAVAGWDRIRADRRWMDLIIVLIVVAQLIPSARSLLQSAAFNPEVVPYPHDVGTSAKILRVGEIDPSHRAAWMSGYLNLYDRRFDAYTAAPIATERYLRLHAQVLAHPSRELLDVLPAGYILTALEIGPPFERVAHFGGAKIFRNPAARPMASFVTHSRRILPAKWSLDSSHARVEIDAPEEGVLVLAQQDAPEWQLTVDGKKAEKRLVFGVFRGVNLAAGRHEVVWTYRSRAFFWGAAMTLVTLLATQVFLFVKRTR